MLNQPDTLYVNIDESSFISTVKGLYLVEASSEDLHLPPEVGINQVGESAKVINYKSWKCLN